MTTVKYDDSLYAFDFGMVRSFLILGSDKALLLDAGVEKADMMGAIREITDLPVKLCLSHSDHDHTTNIDAFKEIWLHEDEVELLKNTGAAESLILRPLKDKDTFDLGGRTLKVIHCPGHTDGSLSLLDEAAGILFSGDTVSYGPVYMFGENRDTDDYLATLKMLNGLYESGAFSDIYPCHNTCPISGGCINDLIACVEKMRSGELEGEPTSFPEQDGKPVKVFYYGSSGIFHVG